MKNIKKFLTMLAIFLLSSVFLVKVMQETKDPSFTELNAHLKTLEYDPKEAKPAQLTNKQVTELLIGLLQQGLFTEAESRNLLEKLALEYKVSENNEIIENQLSTENQLALEIELARIQLAQKETAPTIKKSPPRGRWQKFRTWLKKGPISKAKQQASRIKTYGSYWRKRLFNQ